MTQLSASEISGGFSEKAARVNGVTLNYAIGGAGPAVVLLHGYPQTWYMWRKVMPALAGEYTVIAPDMRGSGGSEAPATGYDKAGLAEDVHQLLVALGHADQVSVVGHDIGGAVSYAYAARAPGLGTPPGGDRGAAVRREPVRVPVGDCSGSRPVELRLLHP
jgi:pimeloyl-ACP methyl ester carboxylesterase